MSDETSLHTGGTQLQAGLPTDTRALTDGVMFLLQPRGPSREARERSDGDLRRSFPAPPRISARYTAELRIILGFQTFRYSAFPGSAVRRLHAEPRKHVIVTREATPLAASVPIVCRHLQEFSRSCTTRHCRPL
ncbi:hypothetical protein GN956_G17822 [Arapaima gigas]